MLFLSRMSAFLPFALLLALTTCSSNSSPNASIQVTLVDGPIQGYSSIVLNIQKVDIHASTGGWTTLSEPKQSYDLLTLINGVSQQLANTTIAEGEYQQMRLVLGDTGNTITLAGESTSHPLEIPSGIQTGIKMPLSFNVVAGTTKDIFIDFDAAHSIHLVHTGASNRYILRPVIQAYDKVVTGSISGKFTVDSLSGTALAGAMVYAQTVDSHGEPTIVASTVTKDDGTYLLNLLPVGGIYYVVSMPVSGTTVYEAKISAGLPISSTAPLQTHNQFFVAALNPGSISGAVTPAALDTQGDVINLRKSFDIGGTSSTFVVATSNGVVTVPTVGDRTEAYQFPSVPVGDFSVVSIRTTLDSNGTPSTQTVGPLSVTVSAGLATTKNIAF